MAETTTAPIVGDRVEHRRTGETGTLLKVWGKRRISAQVSWDRGGQGIGWLDDLTRTEGEQ